MGILKENRGWLKEIRKNLALDDKLEELENLENIFAVKGTLRTMYLLNLLEAERYTFLKELVDISDASFKNVLDRLKTAEYIEVFEKVDDRTGKKAEHYRLTKKGKKAMNIKDKYVRIEVI